MPWRGKPEREPFFIRMNWSSIRWKPLGIIIWPLRIIEWILTQFGALVLGALPDYWQERWKRYRARKKGGDAPA